MCYAAPMMGKKDMPLYIASGTISPVLLHLTKKVLHATKCLLALFWAELFCDTNFLRFSLCLFTGNGPKKGKIIMNIKKESESASWTWLS